MTLERYGKKRDFRRTTEPPPRKIAGRGALTFVIQKHRARQLHYDFRLELDGVLKSWSVPKGPSLDPTARHLAVMVEDHPLDYASFEGAIPKGEYGAGEVMVWDRGTYSPDEGGELLFEDRAAAQKKVRRGIEEGKLSITLRGKKLKGSWALVKMQKRQNDWLLIKHRDEYAESGFDILSEDRSALSGRTIEEIRDESGDDPPRTETSNNGDVLAQLKNPENDFDIEVEGTKISLSNMDKTLWPAQGSRPGFTKRDLLKYLVAVAPYILRHLKDRPLTLSRYPDGISGEHFWQKHWGHTVPGFVRSVNITEEKGTRSEYMICDNLATLLWLGQAANLEFHAWFSRVSAAPDMPKGKSTDELLDYPDFIIFDLDPYIYSGKERRGAEPELNRAGFDRAGEIALNLKKILDELGLNAFIKTSGKTGLHIHVPILRRFDYKSVRATAEAIGKYLVQKHPDDVTMAWAQEKRRGKIFVDYEQNVRGKTLACAYSPRPAPGAPVSTPLRWEELGRVYPTDFTLATLPARLKKTGDLWANILSTKKDLNTLSEM